MKKSKKKKKNTRIIERKNLIVKIEKSESIEENFSAS